MEVVIHVDVMLIDVIQDGLVVNVINGYVIYVNVNVMMKMIKYKINLY
jgi:hypothetical protein